MPRVVALDHDLYLIYGTLSRTSHLERARCRVLGRRRRAADPGSARLLPCNDEPRRGGAAGVALRSGADRACCHGCRSRWRLRDHGFRLVRAHRADIATYRSGAAQTPPRPPARRVRLRPRIPVTPSPLALRGVTHPPMPSALSSSCAASPNSTFSRSTVRRTRICCRPVNPQTEVHRPIRLHPTRDGDGRAA